MCTALLLKLEVCTPVCVCVCVCVCLVEARGVHGSLGHKPQLPHVCAYVGVPMCVPKCARGVNGSLGHQPQFPWFS